ncbi:DUF4198 domain-containing protein [Mucilaginibacter polytrichastri]|uniref:DUF4198 domain-containing protein n=1 Tax=Mucilaginibacter polytrichastri TaxID=1302689 RepID=A0A1Q6A4A1_9SPHI|nr:DUF4198 domain-containing protein [Mucilaginibacter polytrichastri]OKS88832.1 hypothetical protein RG47T_4310 [Mucilaginibacter polytrichastri]SFT06258.1 protein of unknown function [Mucilaginibacter polytrichastri]
MKNFLLILIFLTCAVGSAYSQADYFLLPENFFPQKGDNLNLHLLSGNSFSKGQEQQYDAKTITKALLLDGGKPDDLSAAFKQGNLPALTSKLSGTGMALFAVVNQQTADIDRKPFINYLTDNGLDKTAEGLKQFQQSFKQKTTNVMKSLVAIEKNSGGVQEKPLKEDFELILKQNPYKGNYGDDITAVLLFKGQPIKGEKVTLLIRSPKGTEFSQLLATDETGAVFLKLSREGTYMLQSIHIEPAKDQTLDFEAWQTSFTFAFSSTNTMPNSYKEFGMGNLH